MSKFFRKAPRTVTRSWKHQTRSVHQWAKFKRFVADMPQDLMKFDCFDWDDNCVDPDEWVEYYYLEGDDLLERMRLEAQAEEDRVVRELERQYGITTYHQELLVYSENTIYELKCVVCEDWAYTVQVSKDCIYEGVPDDDFYVSEDEYQDEQDELVRLRDQYYWIPEGWKRGGDYEDEVADLAWESRWLTIQLDIQVLSIPQETLEVEDSALSKTSLKYFRLQKYLGPRAEKFF